MIQTPEAQLAYLGFGMIAPSPPLRPYVRSYWVFARHMLLPDYHEEYMHPTGGYGIVFNFGDTQRLDGQSMTAPVFLDGANTHSRRLGFSGHIALMGVRFQPGGAFPFLGMPLIALQNKSNLIEALDERSLIDLHGRLVDAESVPARVALLESWLLRRLSAGGERSAIIPESIGRLHRTLVALKHGEKSLSIASLAHDLAVSQRQLEHLYRTQVGMSPLRYIQLQRVEMARLALKHKKQSNTRLALDLGYYDQAHFIREFSAVIGMTPFVYMKRKHTDATG